MGIDLGSGKKYKCRIMKFESEQFISDHLINIGLHPERFNKSALRVPRQKTPDFKVFQGDVLEAYCEVKEMTDADLLEDPYHKVSPGIHRADQLSDGKSQINR